MYTEYNPPELARARWAHFEEVFATGQPQQFEDSRHGMDFLHSLYPVCDADGRVVRVVVYSTDVTARKLVEAALREREARYRELVQNANSAILRWRRDGTIVFFNEFAQRFFGYDADEVMGKPVSIDPKVTLKLGSVNLVTLGTPDAKARVDDAASAINRRLTQAYIQQFDVDYTLRDGQAILRLRRIPVLTLTEADAKAANTTVEALAQLVQLNARDAIWREILKREG